MAGGRHKKRLSPTWLVACAIFGVLFLILGLVTILLHQESPVVTGDARANQPAEIAKIKAALVGETDIAYDDNSGKSEPTLIVKNTCTVDLLWTWDGENGEYQYNAFPGGQVAAPYKPVLINGNLDASGIRNSCMQFASAPAPTSSSGR
ncbi:MAG: hypothetical protein PVI21_06435 [Candidatus Woesebacteria bacterium]|jgi:hypothetical protein